MEKYTVSGALNPAITEDEDCDKASLWAALEF